MNQTETETQSESQTENRAENQADGKNSSQAGSQSVRPHRPTHLHHYHSKHTKKFSTKDIPMLSILFAMAAVLNFLEGTLLPSPLPGVHLGLSNVPVMYSLFFVNPASALILAVLKSVLAFITRGPTAAFLSCMGGVFSIAIMVLIKNITKRKKLASLTVLSISGAIAHNVGQLIGIAIMYRTLAVTYYAPMLLIAGIISGVLTASLLNLIFPTLKKIDK